MNMFDNKWYLQQIKESFKVYLENGSSTSPDKLKSLHSAFANNLLDKFKDKFITIKSLGLEDENGKEGIVSGHYSKKKVDITLFNNENEVIAGYAVKFAMRNIAQNLVNYFDNMLGENVNIRLKDIPYFQILILFDKVPYFKSDGTLDHWEDFTNDKKDKFTKYEILSKDNPAVMFHSPDKMLFVLLHLKEPNDVTIARLEDYKQYYLEHINDEGLITFSDKINKDAFDPKVVIVNDFKKFIDKSCNLIEGRS